MIVQMIACDNPNCKEVKQSESEEPTLEPMPPYGWIRMSGFRMGTGPDIPQVDVCSTECLGPAVKKNLDKSFEMG